MATIQELKEVVKETLENRGVLGQLKARVRAEVFNALDDHSEEKPHLSNENMLINELIREYLAFNKYKYTTSTLLAESGQPQTPLDREFLSNELNIMEDRETSSVPILYSIVSHFMNQGQSRSSARQHTPRASTRKAQSQSQRNRVVAGEDEEDYNLGNGGLVVHGGRR